MTTIHIIDPEALELAREVLDRGNEFADHIKALRDSYAEAVNKINADHQIAMMELAGRQAEAQLGPFEDILHIVVGEEYDPLTRDEYMIDLQYLEEHGTAYIRHIPVPALYVGAIANPTLDSVN